MGAAANLTIVCVGTSLRTAPVSCLEGAVAGASRLAGGFRGAAAHGSGGESSIQELAVLRTCNRVEAYVAVHETSALSVHGWLLDVLSRNGPVGTPGTAARPPVKPSPGGGRNGDSGLAQPPDGRFYLHVGAGAVRHLCRVAAGLDSLVLGEHQIAGQVARAFRTEGAGPTLQAAAEAARDAGRRARLQTAIGQGPTSVSSVAVRVVKEHLGDLEGSRILVIGAGKMGRLACDALRKGGASVSIANRTPARSAELADALGCRAVGLSELESALADSDAVLSSTSSPKPIIGEALLRRVLRSRESEHPLLLVDMAVPRDIEPRVGDLSGARLVHLARRLTEVPEAEAIVDEEVEAYLHRTARAVVAPVVRDLWSRAEAIRRSEVDVVLGELEDLDSGTRDRIERLSRTLVRKILRQPTARLRESEGTASSDLARVARELFGLPESPVGAPDSVDA